MKIWDVPGWKGIIATPMEENSGKVGCYSCYTFCNLSAGHSPAFGNHIIWVMSS